MKSRYYAGERIWFAIAVPKRWWRKFDWWLTNLFLKIVIEEDKKSPDKMKTRLCHDNCSFLCPKELDQTREKEPHRCFLYHKTLKHQSYHPHLVACKNCLDLSVNVDSYMKD